MVKGPSAEHAATARLPVGGHSCEHDRRLKSTLSGFGPAHEIRPPSKIFPERRFRGFREIAARHRNYKMLISVLLGRGRSSSHHAEAGEDEADAKNGQGCWLGDWRSEEAVRVVVKTSNDL